MNAHWQQHWSALVRGQVRGFRPAVERCCLWVASLPYAGVSHCRNRLYDLGWLPVARAAVPVVSIGNLTVGGTGKTPMVEYVARWYRRHGLRVAILSRGYGSTGGCNDEALVLAANLPGVPHLQGADRVALAARAVADLESEVLVLDDGFQHRRLARDLDVVLIDATQPWGHGFQLPRGLLREAPSGLRRAGVVVVTRCDQVAGSQRDPLRRRIQRLAPGVPVAWATHRPVELVGVEGTAPLALLDGRPVVAFGGIGNPAAFRQTLESLGAVVRDFRAYPDHHAYSRTDRAELDDWARGQARDCLVVTTQKDLVKLRLDRLGGLDLWAVRVRLSVEAGQEALDRRLLSAVRLPQVAG